MASLRQAGQQGGGTSWDLGEMESHRQGHLRGDLSRALHLTEGESEAQRGCGLCPKVITEFCRASSEIQFPDAPCFPDKARTGSILLLADEVVR